MTCKAGLDVFLMKMSLRTAVTMKKMSQTVHCMAVLFPVKISGAGQDQQP